MNRFRFHITVLPYAFLVFSSLNLFSQDLQQDYLSHMPDAALFENYMEAAGRHDEHSQWLSYAESGFDSAMASWENEFLMFADNSDSEVLRLEAQEELNRIISNSYAEWLCERFFREIPVPSISGLSSEIAVLNEQYLYDVQPDGSIRYRNSEGYEDSAAEKGEHSLWREGVFGKMADLLAHWNEQMTTAFSELRASISENTVIEALNEKYNRSLEVQREKYRNQLYRLYQTEQSRFASVRLNDQYSLQQISEKESASNVTDEILTAVQDELDGGLASLKSCLEGRAENPGAVSADSESQSWRDQFQILLDKGLAQWDSAEERLLMERISWEKEAGRTAAEGEHIWAEAWAQLNAKRTEWMTEFRETLEEGSRLWSLENEKLEDSIVRAVNEIDRNIADTGASLQNRIDNLIGIMLQSAEMMQTSESSWNYWMSCYASGANKSFNSALSGLTPQRMRTVMNGIRPASAGVAADSAWKEAEYWAGIFETYYSYAEDAHKKLSGTYGITVLDDASLTTAFDGINLSETLTNVFMDEPQIELMKADAYLQYWQRQHDLAQTVYDYASDYSSVKESATVTIGRLNEAKTAYDEIFSEYSDCIERLNSISSELAGIQLDLNLIRQETALYQQQLSEVRDEYTRTIADLETDDLSYLSEEFRNSFEQLLITSGLKSGASAAPSTALENYLLAAVEYGYENKISLLSVRLKELINGKDLPGSEAELNTGSLSFSELENRMKNTASAGFCIFADAGRSEFALEGGGEEQLAAYLSDRFILPMGDYRYDKILECFGLYRGAEPGQKAVLLWEMQRIAEDIKRGYKTDYELRLAELRLLSASEFSGWGETYLGVSDPQDALEDSTPDAAEYIHNAIEEDLAVYRAVLELYGKNKEDVFCIYDWQRVIGSNTIQLCPEQAYQLLWEFHRAEYNSEESAAEALNELVDSLEALSGWVVTLPDTAEPAAAFENAIKNPENSLGQQHLKTYLEGRHTLISDSGGLYSYVYSEKEAENRVRESVKEILRRNINTAPALSEYSVERTKTAFADVLVMSGLYDEQSLGFIEPEDVWNKCGFRSIEDAAEFIRNLEEAVPLLNMPGYISERFAAYTDSLKIYFAVKAAEAGIIAAADASAYDDLIKEKVQQLNNQSDLLIYLQEKDDSCLKLLEIAESSDMPDELRGEAERRYIETSAFELAAAALERADKSVSLSDFLSAAEIDVYREEIIRKAAEYHELADALASPESAAMGIQSADFQRYYRSMLWNTLSFEDAFTMFKAEQAERIIYDLEKARLISSLMPDSASLFPSDAEFEWLYHRNPVLREVDEFINRAAPLLWASDDFNAADEILHRYFPDALLSTYRKILNITASESAAGITFSDKATMLWESEFRAGAESGSFEGLLKAFSGLMLIDEAAENKHSSRKIIESLVNALVIDSADADFLKAASNHAAAAAAARLDNHMQVNTESLSGEALYWNLAWNLRNDALNGEFDIDEARTNYIFDGEDSFRIIEDWITEHQSSYMDFSTGIKELIDSILPEITESAADPFGGIYSDIAAFNAGALLIEAAGYEAEDAAELINWFLDEKGITTELNADSLIEYTSEAYEKRLVYILAGNPSAAEHYLKKRIAANDIGADKLDAVLQRLPGVTAEVKDKLRLDKTLQDDLLVYSPLIHGDFEEFLDFKYSDDEIKRRQREVYIRFRGRSDAQWDDEAFIPALKDNTDAVRILQSIAVNKTEAAEFFYTESGGRVSPNDIFINEVMTVLSRSLYGDESLLNNELGKMLLLKDLCLMAGAYNDSITSPGADSWRSCLKQKYMPEQSDDLELFEAADNDQANIVLDAACCYSERSLQLRMALEHWVLPDTDLPVKFDQLNTALNAENMEYFSDPEIDELFNHTVSSELQNRYEENRRVFNDIEESINFLKNAVRTTGNRYERLLEMSSMSSTQRAEELKPLTERIRMLETRVESCGSRWQDSLNGPEGYRSLELEYADVCKSSEELFDSLEDAKHRYAVAQAVYDYASNGYLRVNMESEQIPDTVRAVDPAARLAEVERNLMRAEAAYNVLENIVGNRKDLSSMYDADPLYREYFDSYMQSCKDALVLNRIHQVLN